MRHRKSGRKLKRTASHRKALLGSLSTSLLRHKRITTTVAKAKETRMVVEKLITRARNAMANAAAATVHARREVARHINDRKVVSELFSTIVDKVGSRPGGYTRIVRLGQRPGLCNGVDIKRLPDPLQQRHAFLLRHAVTDAQPGQPDDLPGVPPDQAGH